MTNGHDFDPGRMPANAPYPPDAPGSMYSLIEDMQTTLQTLRSAICAARDEQKCGTLQQNSKGIMNRLKERLRILAAEINEPSGNSPSTER